ESSILTDDQRLLVQAARRMLAVYQSSVDLIEVGAYRAGVNPQLDLAITLRERLEDVFCQDVHELSPLETSWSRLTEAMGGAG
nr:EscN/YscN/HrcN family type III secretion system ATPase [Actinomycetota bacterium]